MREAIDLSGVWRFQPDPGGEGESRGFAGPGCDDALWREVWVPGTFEAATPALADYEGRAWYRRAIDVPAGWHGRRVVLRFQGVHHHAAVWLNGRALGSHEDGFLPFELDATAAVAWDGANTLAVRVDNRRLPGEVPGLERGWRPSGGLQRRVELEATDPLRIDGLRLTADWDGEAGHLAATATAANGRAADARVVLSLDVLDSAGTVLVSLAAPAFTLAPGEARTVAIEGPASGAAPWSPAAPALYTVACTLAEGDGVAVDRLSRRTGFRRIAAHDGRLRLNGEPLYLTGFNRHEDSPAHGMAEDLATARRDLEQMRAAGANYVRLCHYPHHPDELDLCDELGLLAMGEIPLYWWRGEAEGEGMPAAKLAAAERQLLAMIARDSHHPAVVFWSVSNETEEQRPEVAGGNRHLVECARAADPSRLAVHVSNHWRHDPHFEADDVICVNGYPSLERRGLGGEPDYDLARSTAFWHDGLAALHARYPTKPILVAEFGYAGLEGSRANALGEDLQAAAIEAEFGGMQAPHVCGATVWCWADHAWPANVFTYCHGLAVSPYGIVTRNRRAKAALATVSRLFRERQGIPEDAATGPRWHDGGYTVRMVRPSLDDIPEAPFPEGYGIRAMRPDEGGLWVDIQRDAEPFFTVRDDLFEREFGGDPAATGWRSYLLTGPRGVAVGTMSAWRGIGPDGAVWGQVHWVAVRRAWQRRGLARAGLAYTLRRLATWHDRAYLITSTRRLGAIRLYLDMGFRPDLDHAGGRMAWEEVAREIDHPAIQAALTTDDRP